MVNILGFVSYAVSVSNTHLCHCSIEETINKMWVDGCGLVPIKLYIWKLELKFYILSTCYKIFFWFPFQSLKNVQSLRTFLSCGPFKNKNEWDLTHGL